jgi:uncharacterized protein (DUF924 family)
VGGAPTEATGAAKRAARRAAATAHRSVDGGGPSRGTRAADARVAAGEFDHWHEHPETALAALIALDQLPRNLYRGRAEAYAFDQHALELAHFAYAAGYPEQLHPLAGAFFNLPLEHAEDLALQERSVAGYLKQHARADAAFAPLLHEWVSAGRDHLKVIARFGRFPHRNAIIGRESTAEEREWLASGGKHWGQVAVSDPQADR